MFVRHLLSCANLGEFIEDWTKIDRQNWRNTHAPDADLCARAIGQSEKVAEYLDATLDALKSADVQVNEDNVFVSSLSRTAETSYLVGNHSKHLQATTPMVLPYALEEGALGQAYLGGDNTPQETFRAYKMKLSRFIASSGLPQRPAPKVLLLHQIYKMPFLSVAPFADSVERDAAGYAEISRIEQVSWTSRAAKFQTETLPDDIYKYMNEFKPKYSKHPKGMAVVVFSHGHLISGLLGVSSKCIGNGAVSVAAYKMGPDVARTDTRRTQYLQQLTKSTNPDHRKPGESKSTPPQYGFSYKIVNKLGSKIVFPGEGKPDPKIMKLQNYMDQGIITPGIFSTCVPGACEDFLHQTGFAPKDAKAFCQQDIERYLAEEKGPQKKSFVAYPQPPKAECAAHHA